MNNEAEIKKANALTLDLLEKVTDDKFLPAVTFKKIKGVMTPKYSAEYLDELNFSTSNKVAFGGLFRSGEITYSAADLKHPDFLKNHLLRGDVTFAEDLKYAILRLKMSKTDYKFRGVDIVLAATDHACCPVRALRKLFDEDPQPDSAPLFQYHTKGSAFTYERLVARLRARLTDCKIDDPQGFSGHSFRRGAAQTAENHGFLPHEIQESGRWTSEAFRGYFSKSLFSLYSLNRRLFTKVAPSLDARIIS